MVFDRRTAFAAYWSAQTRREQQAAYHEVLLFGGRDGYREGWRYAVVRWLRRVALVIEGRPRPWVLDCAEGLPTEPTLGQRLTPNPS